MPENESQSEEPFTEKMLIEKFRAVAEEALKAGLVVSSVSFRLGFSGRVSASMNVDSQ